MHRIRFAFCALALIGMAAPASAQGPIRNWLRSRRPTADTQNVMPAPTVTTGTTATIGSTGTTGTVAAGATVPTGPVPGPAATVPGPTTSKYAPAGTSPVTPAAATTTTTTMGVSTGTTYNTGRRGLLFGRRRGTQPVYTNGSVPAPSTIPSTPVPGGTTPKPLPTTIGEKTTPGGTTATASTATTTMQSTDTTQTRSRRLFAGRFMGRVRMMRG